MGRTIKGLFAGMCGTVAMGGFAFLARRMVEPERQIGKTHYERAVEWAADRIQPGTPVATPDRIRLGEISHLGFGAFWGAVFTLVHPAPSVRPFKRGALWGAGLWLAAFGGYMPRLGISKSLSEMENYERLRTLGSHLVYAIFTWVFLSVVDRD